MMEGGGLIGWVFASLLLSLRIAPAFAMAPPFTLTRIPAMFRTLFALGIAACLVSANPQATAIADFSIGGLAAAAIGELALGAIVAMAFQIAFGALYMAGRTIDIQSGYGLALLIDPTTKTQTPLVGTLFALAAGAVFFAMDGHAELLRVLAASLEAIPLGGGDFPTSLGPLTSFVAAAFVTAFGVAGGAILSLFLADLAVAMLSRTAPQMNVLLLGFQVKAILLLLVLPLTFGVAGALLARLCRLTLEAIPRLL